MFRSFIRVLAASVVVVFFALPQSAVAAPQMRISVPYVEGAGFVYGVGYDSKTNSILAPCVSGNKPSPDFNSGQRVQNSLHLIDEAKDFSDELEISTSESVKSGLANESMNADIMNHLKISSHSVTYVAKVDIKAGDMVLDGADLTEDYKTILITKQGHESLPQEMRRLFRLWVLHRRAVPGDDQYRDLQHRR